MSYFKLFKFFLIILLWFLSGRMGAQQKSGLDSLSSEIKTAKEDSNKVLLLIEIAKEHRDAEPEKAKAFYRQAKVLSDRISFYAGSFKSLTEYGSLLLKQSQYDSSIILFRKAKKLAEENKDSRNVGQSLINLGLAYNFKGDYELALEHIEKGRLKTESGEGNEFEGQIHNTLQLLYTQLNQYDKAIEHGETAKKLLTNTENSSLLGAIILNLGNAYGAKRLLKQAKNNYNEALSLSRKINDPELESTALLNLLYFDLKALKLDNIENSVARLLEINRKTNDNETILKAHMVLGFKYLMTNDFEKSKIYLDSSLYIANLYDLSRDKQTAFENLAYLHFAIHDYLKADEYLDSAENTGMQVINEELQKNIQELEKKYEAENRQITIELQKEELQKKNFLNILFAGGTLALAALFLLSFRNYRQKQKIQKQRIAELEVAHRLNAAQAVLKGEEQERARLAKDLHDGLSGMLSGIKYSLQDMKGNLIMTEENGRAFERSIDMLDSSIQEMRRVAHNMMPEVLVRYGLDAALKDYIADINQSGRVKVVYQSMGMENQQIENSSAIAIYRIVQELLNNVIKHAQATETLVQLFNENGKLVVNVEDNGKGFDTRLSEEKGGMGWRNIRSRVELLSGKIDLQSAPGQGTAVNLEFSI